MTNLSGKNGAGRAIRVALVTLLMAAGLLAVAKPAAADDSAPCWYHQTRTVQNPNGSTVAVDVYKCSLWTGNVPVRESPAPGAPIVGYLNQGGSVNWFTSQGHTGDHSRQYLNGYHNKYWAHTMADNGRWGFVSEVYFTGGGNDEPDAGLPREDWGRGR